jgi:hypothetical protein
MAELSPSHSALTPRPHYIGRSLLAAAALAASLSPKALAQ